MSESYLNEMHVADEANNSANETAVKLAESVITATDVQIGRHKSGDRFLYSKKVGWSVEIVGARDLRLRRVKEKDGTIEQVPLFGIDDDSILLKKDKNRDRLRALFEIKIDKLTKKERENTPTVQLLKQMKEQYGAEGVVTFSPEFKMSEEWPAQPLCYTAGTPEYVRFELDFCLGKFSGKSGFSDANEKNLVYKHQGKKPVYSVLNDKGVWLEIQRLQNKPSVKYFVSYLGITMYSTPFDKAIKSKFSKLWKLADQTHKQDKNPKIAEVMYQISWCLKKVIDSKNLISSDGYNPTYFHVFNSETNLFEIDKKPLENGKDKFILTIDETCYDSTKYDKTIQSKLEELWDQTRRSKLGRQEHEK